MESWMPLYVNDFLGSPHVAEMSMAQRGLYVELLMRQWQLGVLPSDETRLSRLVGLPLDEFRGLWPLISRSFEADADGAGLRNPRLEQIRGKHAAAYEGRCRGLEKAREARWAGKKKASLSTDQLPDLSTSLGTSLNQNQKNNKKNKKTSGASSLTRRTTTPRAGARDSAAFGEKTKAGKLLVWWRRHWLEGRGTEYVPTGADRGSALWLVRQDAEEVRVRGERLLGTTDPWLAERASLAMLRSQWNRLGSPATPEERTQLLVEEVMRESRERSALERGGDDQAPGGEPGAARALLGS